MISPKSEGLLLPDSEPARRHFRLLGFAPLLFFILHGVHYWRIDEMGQMFWICNVANLVLAVGLFLNNARIIRVTAIWMVPGLVMWFLYVVLTWGVFLTSTLVHLGGVIVAIIAIRKIGMDRDSWLYALAGYLVVQMLSRLLTPVAFNVNISHTVYDGWQTSFDAYWKFWLVSTLISIAVMWFVGLVLRRLWPAEATLELSPAVR